MDLWFQPISPPEDDDRANFNLGLLGTLTQAPCLLEPYRNPPDFRDLRSCLAKRLAIVADQERKTPALREADLPHLWILTPTLSDAARHHCAAIPDPDLVPGCYRLAPLLGTHLIALHQLPPTPDTLWLRLLGKGHCQRQAIHEVLALPHAAPYRDRALQLLANWKIALETLQPNPSEEEETLMALTQAYLEWEHKTVRLGEVQGEQRERRRLVLEMLELELEFKFGEQGRSLLPYLQQVSTTDLLYDFLRSLKPLTEWIQVQTWWLDRLAQTVTPSANPSPSPAALAVALKLCFPTADTEAIDRAQAHLWTQTQDGATLRQHLAATTEISLIGS